MLLLTILVPLVGSGILFAFKPQKPCVRNAVVMGFTILTSILAFACILNPNTARIVLMPIGDMTYCALNLDGLGRVFTGLIATLWPLASLYGIGYMEHEGKETLFFGFYMLSYAVTLALAFSENLMTLFIFYEMLALSTLFLVMHKMKTNRVHAGRKYMYYSLGAASLGFVSLMAVQYFTGTTTFVYGGIEGLQSAPMELILWMFVLGFFGFGVKAAIFPLHGWLPSAGVAPTPVTALLHAVAVVKAGAFAVIRLAYYVYGPDLLYGTWAQTLCLIVAMISILYGSSMAVKEQHLKRRLAYSTMSNLSYVILGAMMLTPAGLQGALLHMVYHAMMKITLFSCVGAVMIQTGRNYVEDLRGIAKHMPLTLGVFAFCAIALVGIPPFVGFQSKWALAMAGLQMGNVLGIASIVVLLISAVLTAIYLLVPVVCAYSLPMYEGMEVKAQNVDPDYRMLIPFFVLVAMIVYFTFASGGLTQLLSEVANGLW